MKSLELNVKKNNDVLLPAELAICGLTLEEVGFVFTLYAVATGTLEADEIKIIDTEKSQAIMANLRDRGILKADATHDGLRIDLDITNV